MHRSRIELLNTILSAACEAVTDAETHHLKPSELPLLNEQWTQSYVGIKVNDLLRKRYSDRATSYVTFETNVSWLEGYCGVGNRVGRPPGSLTSRQRFDVIAWSRAGHPEGLIEIKDQPIISSYGQTNDPKKLRSALARWPSLKWAVFLLSVRASRSQRPNDVEIELGKKSERVVRRVQSVLGTSYAGHRTKTVGMRDARTQWLAILLQRPNEH